MSKTILSGHMAFLVLAILVLGPGEHARAGHPLGTEDAETLGRGAIEVEFNYERSSAGAGVRDTILGNSYTLGLTSGIDLGITTAGRPIGSRDRDDRVSASFAWEWEATNRGVLVGEYLWEKNIGGSGSVVSELLVGGKVEISRNLTFDAGIRWGMTDASPDVTYLAGVTLAYAGEETAEYHPQDERDNTHETGKETR